MARRNGETATLASLEITSEHGQYVLKIEDEAGNAYAVVASYEQLELIGDAIDQVLDDDEEAGTEVEGDETIEDTSGD